MNSNSTNSSEENRAVLSCSENQNRLPRWMITAAGILTVYYVISSLTLPFADDVWFGEIPLLALIQIPKSFAISAVQDVMISWLPTLRLATGSASPDRILTHPWAIGTICIVPPLLLCGVQLIYRGRERFYWVSALVVTAILDASVTYWFITTASLKIF